MRGDVCPECHITPGYMTCANCIDKSVRRFWVEVGVPEKYIDKWRAAGFDPHTTIEWLEHGCSITTATAWSRIGASPDAWARWTSAGGTLATATKWISSGLPNIDAATDDRPAELENFWCALGQPEQWYQEGVTPPEAVEWERRGFGVADSRPWRQRQISPKAAFHWRALLLDPDEVAAWKQLELAYKDIKAWRLDGYTLATAKVALNHGTSPQDPHQWAGVPLCERPRWRKAGIDAETAADWTRLLDEEVRKVRPSPFDHVDDDALSDPWTPHRTVDGLTVTEAVLWAKHGFTTDGGIRDFRQFRERGCTPESASWVFTTWTEDWNEWDPVDLVIRAADYNAAGIPSDPASLTTWYPLHAEDVLKAVDRGFRKAAEYLPFEFTSVNGDDARQLMEIAGNAELALEIWAVTDTDLSAETAAEWIFAGIPADEIRSWIAARFTVEVAAEWRRASLPAAEARAWQSAGFADALVAMDWDENGFTPGRAAAWRDMKFEPSEAKKWASAAIAPEQARRRADAGITPPQTLPTEEREILAP